MLLSTRQSLGLKVVTIVNIMWLQTLNIVLASTVNTICMFGGRTGGPYTTWVTVCLVWHVQG